MADKMMVVTALVAILSSWGKIENRVGIHVDMVLGPIVLIIGREIFVSALREWMAGQGKRDTVG